MDFGALVAVEPAEEPPAPPAPPAPPLLPPALPLAPARVEVTADLVLEAVKVARLRVPLRVIGMPEVPKLAPVPATGMVALRGSLLVTTTTLFCDVVRETVVAAEVTDADEDPVTDTDEDVVAEADVLVPEPPLILNRPVKLMSDP